MALPRTAVLGADGFIGHHLLVAYRRHDPAALGTSRRPGAASFLDWEAPDVAPLRLKQNGYDAAILAAALPRIDECEREPERARRINVVGTLEIARQLQAAGIVPVVLSSDYVFDGTHIDGYADDAPTSPNTEYGRHKAEVERVLKDSSRPFLVCRLSKVFGLTRGDGTLLDEMAARLTSGQEVAAAYDQVFCPAWIDDVVEAILHVQRHGLRGVINLCPAECWSRYDLAMGLADALDVARSWVRRISLDDVPALTRRPKCTRLLPERLDREAPYSFTDMRTCVRRVAEGYRRG